MVNKKKTTKKQTSPEWNFPQPPIVCSRCLITLFQNKCPFYFACPFFKEYLNLEVRINKMANEHSVNPHPIPSWLTSRIQSRIFHKTFFYVLEFYLSPNIFLNFLLKLYMPPWRGNSSYSWCSDYWCSDAFASQKKMNLEIFTHVHPSRTLPYGLFITHRLL